MPKKKGHATLSMKKRNQERLQNAELIIKDEMQVYGFVDKLLGDRRINVKCQDGKTRLCKVRGKYKGRLYIHPNDILLVSLREEDDTKGDIIAKYRQDEVHELKRLGEINDTDFELDGGDTPAAGGGNESIIIWTNESIENI